MSIYTSLIPRDFRFSCRPLSTLYGHACLLLISSTQPSYILLHYSTGPSLPFHSSIGPSLSFHPSTGLSLLLNSSARPSLPFYSSPPSPSGPSTTTTYIGHPLGRRPPPWTSTLAIANPDLHSTHRRSSWTLTAALSWTLLYYIYPPILYMLPPPSWTVSALPDPLFPPNPHRLPTFLYYIYPSILYILSPPSRILTALHPDPHHRLLPPPTSFAAPRTFFSF
jgi:hypothetical protein